MSKFEIGDIVKIIGPPTSIWNEVMVVTIGFTYKIVDKAHAIYFIEVNQNIWVYEEKSLIRPDEDGLNPRAIIRKVFNIPD